ncbi:hypothetical protein IMSHALPRED_004617 [Imshaugia aleurites]|uniref:Sulfotransferase n=1 Tax=Imshaugia aleurites TaxID=172621 RepID=A0A8H3J8P8_9LECA|nr:hypothetical protein IMSHALPRED_004617 [Imshaugia aleurites]
MSNLSILSSSVIVFTHVPKSAGCTFGEAFVQAIKPNRPLFGFDLSLFGGFKEFEACSSEVRATIFQSTDAVPTNADFVGGHFSFATTKAVFPQARHIMILREPTARLLSLWVFWRGQPDVELDRWAGWGDIVRLSHLSLETFLEKPEAACNTDNAYIRALLYGHPLVPIDGFIEERHDQAILEDAKRILTAYAYIDILENANIEKCLEAFMLRPFRMKRINETSNVSEQRRTDLHREFTSTALSAMARRTRLDNRLWDYVGRRSREPSELVSLRTVTIMTTVARYSHLLAGV